MTETDEQRAAKAARRLTGITTCGDCAHYRDLPDERYGACLRLMGDPMFASSRVRAGWRSCMHGFRERA
jgi:hypothetical protein